MDKVYVEVLNANGGTMKFDDFVKAVREAGSDAKLWLRAKHAGKLFSWIDAGVHYISTSPQPGQTS